MSSITLQSVYIEAPIRGLYITNGLISHIVYDTRDNNVEDLVLPVTIRINDVETELIGKTYKLLFDGHLQGITVSGDILSIRYYNYTNQESQSVTFDFRSYMKLKISNMDLQCAIDSLIHHLNVNDASGICVQMENSNELENLLYPNDISKKVTSAKFREVIVVPQDDTNEESLIEWNSKTLLFFLILIVAFVICCSVYFQELPVEKLISTNIIDDE